VVARIEDGVDAGKSFADLAKADSLSILIQAPVTRDGTAPGLPAPSPEVAALAAKAFRHEPGDGAAVENIAPDGQQARLFVIETMTVAPAAPQPLAAVRAAAAEGAAREAALAIARRKADAIVAAVRKGGSFAAAVAAQGLPPAQTLAGRRIDIARQQNVPPVVQAFLDTPAKTVQVLPSPQGWVLIHCEVIEPANVDAIPGLVDSGRREIAAQLPDEFAAAFATAAQRAVGTQRNEATITAVTKRLSGSGDAR
jgi:peptidyl-prolyl cis-trans isomerase D